ncbi:hypothetical protein [Wielerella bovis]|uniref:hypothetical protein n=1 Tax=Wielerella bovis TaxID=2917790 RepID=UPI002019BBA2|nr:hypothetical protein [Wielerella bovis]ULJ61018.1 hypothetical protein MIS44_03970 [Wielerella bovis]ULJ63139.1 hypothetical protein MIS46_03545 [Wielerella bovis]ULJ65369.1 hypothetical protein MIS33_03610 [Wielerella bovis]ULJ67716.1 hypothetical protein MIS31_03985 [Wielerella bovis]ULJ69959.1 hypothetical protein MIS45_03750 [Wielerella bovis]
MFFVDRSAVVLKPTQVFLDWLNSTDDDMPDLTLAQLRSNCSVFLLPAFDEPEQAVAYFDERYEEIFVAELASWVGDASQYPKDLSLENFWQFFELEVHDMVLDLVDEELEVSNVVPTTVPTEAK